MKNFRDNCVGRPGANCRCSVNNIGVFQALLFVAAYRLPGGVAAVVGAVGPLVVMGLTWTLDHRRPPALALVAGVLGVMGMAALLLSPGARWDMVGVAAALVGTLCMAAGTFWSRRWRSCRYRWEPTRKRPGRRRPCVSWYRRRPAVRWRCRPGRGDIA